MVGGGGAVANEVLPLTRNVVVTTEKNGFPFIPVVTTTFLAFGLSHYAVGGYSMWVH